MTSLRYSLLATVFLLAAGPAMAVDGDLGGTSTGSSAIDLTLPPTVKLTAMKDVLLAPAAADLEADVASVKDVCVYSNVGTNRNYKVTASGNGTGSAFTVANGAVEIEYTVTFSADVGGGGTELTKLVQSGNLVGGADNYDCTEGENSSFEITFSPEAMQAAFAGNYDGILTLLVSPGTGT